MLTDEQITKQAYAIYPRSNHDDANARMAGIELAKWARSQVAISGAEPRYGRCSNLNCVDPNHSFCGGPAPLETKALDLADAFSEWWMEDGDDNAVGAESWAQAGWAAALRAKATTEEKPA